ncbi:hypothetical protein CDAR_8021 [Caerostris darwini]|uniref:Uncharacterized protein n=1 Tax=Caerostris darwini TaxID=1538125 RepID=A0AAV4RNM0_9ARAC|nr:hypothetical protein CDAR_8021 [Caerostris darwini]
MIPSMIHEYHSPMISSIVIVHGSGITLRTMNTIPGTMIPMLGVWGYVLFQHLFESGWYRVALRLSVVSSRINIQTVKKISYKTSKFIIGSIVVLQEDLFAEPAAAELAAGRIQR